jgi:hypothetical protein
MAVSSKLIEPDGVFKPEHIDQLLGKAYQFEVQVGFRKGKNGGEYYFESAKFVGALGRGNKTPELLTEPCIVGMEDDNSAQSLLNLRQHVINTMKKALNWEDSKIKQQLKDLHGDKNEQPTQSDSSTTSPQFNGDEDDDIPF